MKNNKLYIVLFMLVAGVPFAHAYRDLETGTFLTRDPIGYQDGPNVYCYVHCNPISHFDAFGLAATGIPGLDRNATRKTYFKAWDKSIYKPHPNTSLKNKLLNKFVGGAQSAHEYGFVIMNDGTITDIYKSKDKDSFTPRAEHWKQNKGMYFHTHPDSVWRDASRRPSDAAGWGGMNQLNDTTFAANNGTVITIVLHGCAVTTPDGTTFYINGNDLKPDELEGSAKFYRSWEDMDKQQNGQTMEDMFKNDLEQLDYLRSIGKAPESVDSEGAGSTDESAEAGSTDDSEDINSSDDITEDDH